MSGRTEAEKLREERDIWKDAFYDLVTEVRLLESNANLAAGRAKQDVQAKIIKLWDQ